MKTERELFLEYIKKEYPLTYGDLPDCVDVMHHFSREFKAWQASASRDGYKLAPVEPTEKMMHSALMTVIHKNGDVKALYKAMIGASE